MTESIVQVAIEAARHGGQMLLAVQDRPREVTRKGFRDDVTDADYASENAIIETIRAHFKAQLIVSEENQFAEGIADWEPPDGFWWLIDPLDGTTNFSRGVPHYCVSVAVLQGRTLIGGAIYDPVREYIFAAERGQGATLNGRPLHVSARADLPEAVLEAGLARDPEIRRQGLAIFARLATQCRSVRSSGAAALALAYVAAGWLDGYVHLTLRPWDSAAAGLMIQEAGGRLSLPDGSEWRARFPPILASNAILHEALQREVQQALAGVP
ncbi:MAG: inositol monophosphatase family protein [Anaerolineae bacterium]